MFKFDRIMSASHIDLIAVIDRQHAQSFLIAHAANCVDFHQALVRAQARGATTLRFAHLAAVEIRISSVQQPTTIIASYRNACMTPCVPGKRHQQEFRWQPLQVANRLKAKPRLSRRSVSAPVLYVVELRRSPPIAGDHADMRSGRVIILACHDVDNRIGKVLQTAGMIEIQVGYYDVPNVQGAKAHRFNLSDCCFAFPQTYVEHQTPGQGDARSGAMVRMSDVAQPITRVNEYQAMPVGLDQKTVTYEMSQKPCTASIE